MNVIPRPGAPRLLASALAVLVLLLLGGCGDDGDSTTSSTEAGTTSLAEPGAGDSELLANETADCLEGEGLDPSVGPGEESGAASIDLTTENRTIVVQVFPSEDEAADYKSASGLDQEQVGYAVILGGLVPPGTRQAIIDCLPSL